jgi:hypothetical protein
MDFPDIALTAFRDELEKISLVRIGKPPKLVQTMAQQTGAARAGLGKLFKNAAAPPVFGPKAVGAAALTGAGLGIYGQHKAKKLYNDYQTGKAMRQQSEG